MAKPKIYMVSQTHYLEPFSDLVDLTLDLTKADIVFFTGGEDVSPSLYGEQLNPRTYSNMLRDQREAAIYLKACDWKLKKFGVCRGAQFLTVQAGGRLVQDVGGHGMSHEIFSNRDKTVVVSSTHHQMMNPFVLDKSKYELIAWAEGLSDRYRNGEDTDIPFFIKEQLEPEIVYYPEAESLCIQAHPEIMNPKSHGVEFCRSLFKEYML